MTAEEYFKKVFKNTEFDKQDLETPMFSLSTMIHFADAYYFAKVYEAMKNKEINK